MQNVFDRAKSLKPLNNNKYQLLRVVFLHIMSSNDRSNCATIFQIKVENTGVCFIFKTGGKDK